MKTLREWRVEKLVGVRELSRLSGVSTKTIVDVEYGRQRPSLQTIRRLSETLTVDPRDVTEFFNAMSAHQEIRPPTDDSQKPD